MKRLFKTAIVLLALSGFAFAQDTGTWMPNNYGYAPSLTTQGTDDYTNTYTSQSRIDTKLGQFKAFGDPGYTTLAEALTTIGSTNTTLWIPPALGAIAVSVNTTVPSNVYLRVNKGSYFSVANGVTLTVSGPIEAGPYQIFSWTGTGAIDVSSSPTNPMLFDWWGPTLSSYGSFTGDNGPIFSKAFSSLGKYQTLLTRNGIYRVATPVTYAGSSPGQSTKGIVWEGQSESGTVIYIDVGNNIAFAFDNGGIGDFENMWIKNMTLAGPASCCTTALKLVRFNNKSGTENINLCVGSTDYAVKILGCESCNWDFHFNSSSANAAGIAHGFPANGIWMGTYAGYGGTYNNIRVLKSGYLCCANALYLYGITSTTVEESNLENCQMSDAPYYNDSWSGSGGDKAVFTATVSKLAQVFTLSSPTTFSSFTVRIDRVDAANQLTASLYSTTGGVPNALIATSSKVIPASVINVGNGFFYTFPFADIPLAAGQYAIVLNYDGATVSSYLEVQVKNGGTFSGGSGYYYDGSWHAASWIMGFAVNAGHALTLDSCSNVTVRKSYHESNYQGILVKNSSEIDLLNQETQDVELKNCQNIKITNGTMDFLHIDPLSHGNIIDNLLVRMGLEDYGDTQYVGGAFGWIYYRCAKNLPGNNSANYASNIFFNRFTATGPDDWGLGSHTTWSAETGTVHRTPTSAKLVTTANDNVYYNPPIASVNAIKGNYVTFSLWINAPAGQDWITAGNAMYMQANTGVPVWSGPTAFNIGDVVSGGGSFWVCTLAGTSDVGAPTWPGGPTAGRTTVVDGSVIWTNINLRPTQGSTIRTADSGVGWQRFSVTSYLPANATSYSISIPIYKQDLDNTTLYFAEPSLTVSSLPPRGVQAAANETAEYFEVRGTKIVADAYPPDNGSSFYNSGYYFSKGDVCLNQAAASGSAPGGWSCTTAGSPGTWKAWANLP